jgi:hypothetical protein
MCELFNNSSSTSYFFPTKFPKDTTASIDSLGLRPTSNCFYVKNSRPQFLLFEKKKTDTVSKALTWVESSKKINQEKSSPANAKRLIWSHDLVNHHFLKSQKPPVVLCKREFLTKESFWSWKITLASWLYIWKRVWTYGWIPAWRNWALGERERF